MAKKGRPRSGGEKKRRKVTVQFLERMHTGKVTEPYEILERFIATERADLKDVKVGIAWRLGWRADADGVLILGQCRKRGDLDRELDDYDFIILLNKEAWPTFETERKTRLIFHELCHAQLSLDGNGEPKRNDRGRLICRIRKHDFADFRSVISKYGWQDNLSELAKAGIADAERPLLAEMTKEKIKRSSRKTQKDMQQAVAETENNQS
jgi:hypothetical protein